jgi:hypothetical protein
MLLTGRSRLPPNKDGSITTIPGEKKERENLLNLFEKSKSLIINFLNHPEFREYLQIIQGFDLRPHYLGKLDPESDEAKSNKETRTTGNYNQFSDSVLIAYRNPNKQDKDKSRLMRVIFGDSYSENEIVEKPLKSVVHELWHKIAVKSVLLDEEQLPVGAVSLTQKISKNILHELKLMEDNIYIYMILDLKSKMKNNTKFYNICRVVDEAITDFMATTCVKYDTNLQKTEITSGYKNNMNMLVLAYFFDEIKEIFALMKIGNITIDNQDGVYVCLKNSLQNNKTKVLSLELD